MILGPRQPGNDIDVYLYHLIEDLTKLWDKGVDVFDGYQNETFKLSAMLFCIINDFQHMVIWVDTVLRAIMHTLYVKKTQATNNWNMEEK